MSPSVSSSPPSLTAGALISDEQLAVKLSFVAGRTGLDRLVTHGRIQKSGLALTGHFHGVVPQRVQVLGETEISYLAKLHPDERAVALRGFFGLGLSLVVVTTVGHPPFSELVSEADLAGVVVVLSSERSSHTLAALHLLLDERLAPRTSIHGVLVDVFGLGVLLMGKSGIGKSECALELVMRGHRIVADDIVRCDWRPPGMVFGTPAELLRHHMEVRGLGVLNVKNLLGVTAVRGRKRIDLVVKMEEWSQEIAYDRMGLDDRVHEILGVSIREIVVPVRPGRSMATILEVAARNELIRNSGVHAARDFFSRLHRTLVDTSADTESDLLYPAGASKPKAMTEE